MTKREVNRPVSVLSCFLFEQRDEIANIVAGGRDVAAVPCAT
jgi:hypothetical protein